MNDNEATHAFRSLAEILRSTKLDWLLEEALAEIRRGKPKEKKVRVSESSAFVRVSEEPETPRGKSATFVESIEYTPSEQLDILISALERGVVAPAFMEDQIATVLAKAVEPPAATSSPIEFSFLAEGDDEESRECTEEDRRRRIAIGDTLSHAITLFREEIHAAH